MAWWEERLRALRQQTIRERFPFVPVIDWTMVDADQTVYPWAGNVNLQVIQSYNRAALMHTVLVCSKVASDVCLRVPAKFFVVRDRLPGARFEAVRNPN